MYEFGHPGSRQPTSIDIFANKAVLTSLLATKFLCRPKPDRDPMSEVLKKPRRTQVPNTHISLFQNSLPSGDRHNSRRMRKGASEVLDPKKGAGNLDLG
jgi:hypothetical protein